MRVAAPTNTRSACIRAACCISLPQFGELADFAFEETQRVWRQRIRPAMQLHHFAYINLMIAARIDSPWPVFKAYQRPC